MLKQSARTFEIAGVAWWTSRSSARRDVARRLPPGIHPTPAGSASPYSMPSSAASCSLASRSRAGPRQRGHEIFEVRDERLDCSLGRALDGCFEHPFGGRQAETHVAGRVDRRDRDFGQGCSNASMRLIVADSQANLAFECRARIEHHHHRFLLSLPAESQGTGRGVPGARAGAQCPRAGSTVRGPIGPFGADNGHRETRPRGSGRGWRWVCNELESAGRLEANQTRRASGARRVGRLSVGGNARLVSD